jgi:hypothetical protein
MPATPTPGRERQKDHVAMTRQMLHQNTAKLLGFLNAKINFVLEKNTFPCHFILLNESPRGRVFPSSIIY